jgi:hypothetical protein
MIAPMRLARATGPRPFTLRAPAMACRMAPAAPPADADRRKVDVRGFLPGLTVVYKSS